MAALTVDRLTLSHFRSHRLTKLTLDGRPLAFYGPNGAGKTNILEAVSFLSPGRGLRRAAPDQLIRRPEALGWKIAAELTALGDMHEIETGAEPETPRTVRLDGKAATQTALGRIARVVWLVPSMDRLWTEGADGRRRFLDRMVLSFDPRHAETVLAYEKAMRERNRLLKDQVSDSHWYSALEAQMAEAGEAIRQARGDTVERLVAAQSGAETAFPAAELSMSATDGAAPPDGSEAFAEALAKNRGADMRAGRTLIGPHRADLSATYADKGVPAAQCSTGEQKALLISLVLANARALAQDIGAPPLLLLDEVAAHLDAGRRAALYDEICALGAQAWLTGTGPELFAELDSRAAHYAVSDTDGTTTVQETMP